MQSSVLKIASAPSDRNPIITNISDVNVGANLANAANASAVEKLESDIGLDMVFTNDKILVKALADPAAFINDRNTEMKHIAFECLKASRRIHDLIVGFYPLSGAVAEDISRKFAKQITAEFIKSFDDLIKGVNNSVKKKLVN